MIGGMEMERTTAPAGEPTRNCKPENASSSGNNPSASGWFSTYETQSVTTSPTALPSWKIFAPVFKCRAIRVRREADDFLLQARRAAFLDGRAAAEIFLFQIHHPLQAKREGIAHAFAFAENVEEPAFQPQRVVGVRADEPSAALFNFRP